MLHQEDMQWMPELMCDHYWYARRHPFTAKGRVIDRLPPVVEEQMALNILYVELLDFDPVVELAKLRGYGLCESCYGEQRVKELSIGD